MTRTCDHRILHRLLVLLLHMFHKFRHTHSHSLQRLAQCMILICHGLLEGCHQLVVLRRLLGNWYGRLYDGLQLSYDLGPRIRICCYQSILNFLGNLGLLRLSLHLFSDPLDLSLESNILRIRLCLGIYHCPELCRRRWWIIGRSFCGV